MGPLRKSSRRGIPRAREGHRKMNLASSSWHLSNCFIEIAAALDEGLFVAKNKGLLQERECNQDSWEQTSCEELRHLSFNRLMFCMFSL